MVTGVFAVRMIPWPWRRIGRDRCGTRIGRAERCFLTSTSRRGSRRTIRCGRCGGWPTRRWPNSRRGFWALYEGIGRPSIPPERLLRASLLQLLYSIRSERQLVERLEFDMLFRWFVGLTIDEKVFDASTFSKNRDRLLTHEIAQEFLSSLLGLPEVKGLLSAEHFSVDGTMLKAWASMKSFRPKGSSDGGPGNGPDDPPQPGRNREADFRKTKRSNATHASTTDKDARLYRKGAGQESRLAYLGHALMENRNGLVAAVEATLATGTAEREAAAAFSQRLPKDATLGADKSYDAEAFVESLKACGIGATSRAKRDGEQDRQARKTAVPPQVAASLGYATI